MTNEERMNFIQHISFEGEIDDYGDMPRFQIKQDFDVAAVFQGIYDPSIDPAVIHVCAAVDPWSGEAWNVLEVEFGWTDEGYDVRDYPLSRSERVILKDKMAEYCQQQTGMALDEFMLQYWPGHSGPATSEPLSGLSINSGFDLMGFFASQCVSRMAQDVLNRSTPEEWEKLTGESQKEDTPEEIFDFTELSM